MGTKSIISNNYRNSKFSEAKSSFNTQKKATSNGLTNIQIVEQLLNKGKDESEDSFVEVKY